MPALSGAPTLARFILRRDRVRITVWLLALVGLAFYTAISVQELYGDPDDLAEYAATVESNAALVAISGPAHALDTIGGRIAWELWPFGPAVALMAIFAVGRHTRTEEENGRAELISAAVVGSHGRSSAAFGVATATCVVLGAGIAAGLIARDLPLTGSLVLGASFTAIGVVFAAVSLLVAQVTEHARAATGIAAGVVGVAFLVRAIGDVSAAALSWMSPLGWMQRTQPYAGDRWWPLLLSLGFAAALAAVAFRLEARRDLGAGLVRPRPGPPSASASLGRPVGLAWRLQRSALLAWTGGVFLGGVAMGSIAHSAEDLVGDNEAIRDFLAQLGDASLTDVFLATILVYFGLLAAGYGLQSALRLRSEETAGRAEPVLATSISRRAWSGGHLVLAFGGSVIVLAAGGLGAGIAHAAATGDLVEVPRVFGSALVFVPAVWVTVAVAVALFGLVPRGLPLVWAVLALSVVVGMLAEALDLPGWVRALSPFDHIPDVPAFSPSPVPLAVLTAIAALLALAGLVGFARRDVAST